MSSAYSSNNTESINVPTPQSGTYYVRFFGYSAVSGLTLKASYTYGTPTSCTTTYTLTNGSYTTGNSVGAQLYSCTCVLNVPAGKTSVLFQTYQRNLHVALAHRARPEAWILLTEWIREMTAEELGQVFHSEERPLRPARHRPALPRPLRLLGCRYGPHPRSPTRSGTTGCVIRTAATPGAGAAPVC